MTKLIVGCGYLGRRVADLWLPDDEVVAVTRSAERAREFAAHNLRPIVGDITNLDALPRLPDADVVLFAVGFDRTAGNAIDEVYVDGLRNTLARLGQVGRLVYISTTGVYSQSSGEWIDEATETCPQRPGGRASLAAEQLLAGSALADRVIVLRLAGIYGPDRVPNRRALIAGEAISSPSTGYLNLIHVDDAAQIVVAAAEQLRPPETLLVADGNPVLRREYYREVAELIGAAEPRFATPDPDSPATARAAADKRISNAKLVERLQYSFRFPSYREGLAHILT